MEERRNLVIMNPHDDNNHRSMKIIDFAKDRTCYGPDLPPILGEIRRYTVTLGYTDRQLIACGGYGITFDFYTSNECWSYEQSEKAWFPVQNMRTKSAGFGGVNLHNGHSWFIAGGLKEFNFRTVTLTGHKTTQIFTKGNYWAQGPELPEVMFTTCMVQLNECETLISGSVSDSRGSGFFPSVLRVLVFNWNTRVCPR